MKCKDKRSCVGLLQIVLLFVFCAALVTGCGSGSRGDNDSGGNGDDGGAGAPIVGAGNASITVNPSSIPSDGESEAVVTVMVVDDNGNPLDNHPIWLEATVGTIISENPTNTWLDGRADFTIQAPSSSNFGTLTLRNYPDAEAAEILFGTLGSGKPASIRIESVSSNEIAVTGVGQADSAAVIVRVLDEARNSIIQETDYMLEVSFLARPQGGEFLGESGSGIDNRGDDRINNGNISIPIINGESSFNVQSGNIPGVVEILVEVLYNNQSLVPAVKTLIPQLSIASGPPHILSLSAPRMNAVVDLNVGPDEGIPQTAGFYSRRAGLSVLDRWGNAVPDGTVINLGVMDTIIASGEGRITQNSDRLLHTGGGSVNFKDDYVLINGTHRKIQTGDRVVIRDAKAQNKSRFVDGVVSPGELSVNRPYRDSENNRSYVVGASLLGASIYGITEDGEATKGTLRTKNGLGNIRFVYPANHKTIRAGSVVDDPRFWPAGSARVTSIYTTSDNSATMVDTGTLGFSSIAGWSLTARPAEISSSANVQLSLVDGGDEISLPLVTLSPSVNITSQGEESQLFITASPCTTHTYVTGTAGTCTSIITVTGAESGDSATITYFAGDAEVEVEYSAP